jgi:hypothetical protein
MRPLLASIAAVVTLLVAAAPAGAGSETARASGEELVTYLTGGKLKPRKQLRYQFVCAVGCSVTVSSKLKLKGPDLGPVVSSGALLAGQAGEAVIELNKGARSAIKAAVKKAKLVTQVTATNVGTGEVDVDSRTYRFKR